MTDYNANLISQFTIVSSDISGKLTKQLVVDNIKQSDHHDHLTVINVNVTTEESYDFKIPPKTAFYYDMRGLDIDCGTPTYRFWTTKEAPDLTGAYYTDTKCGISPLTDIVVVRKYVKVG